MLVQLQNSPAFLSKKFKEQESSPPSAAFGESGGFDVWVATALQRATYHTFAVILYPAGGLLDLGNSSNTNHSSSTLVSAEGLPRVPKVALLFLTRGPMPLEPIWAEFLSAAAAALGSGATSLGGDAFSQEDRAAAANSSISSTPAVSAWQALFSLYAHPPPDFAYPPGSLFAGAEVHGRVVVKWGQHSVVSSPQHACGTAACRQRAMEGVQWVWLLKLCPAVPL
jgi:hypothetical protein